MDKNTTMENLARALQEKDGFNGAWLYAENGEIVSKGALGFRDPENTLPITEDTIFQLASISKQSFSARRTGSQSIFRNLLRMRA